MKLRKGERITCSLGHIIGEILTDVQDDDPVSVNALAMSRGRIPAGEQRWVCLECNGVVAIRGRAEALERADLARVGGLNTSPDLAILRWLAGRACATAPAIGIACRMTGAEVRGRLVALESRRFVSSRTDPSSRPPQRVYAVTREGCLKAGVSDARARDA